MKTINSLLKKLKQIQDPLKKKIFFAAILAHALKTSNISPIVVGGTALEFYTTGGYATHDIDLIFSNTKLLNDCLTSWGFKKSGRHWINEDLDIFVEAPGSTLTDEEALNLVKVNVEGVEAFLLGVEDLILDRLNAFVHWQSKDDGYWAKELLYLYKDEIDLPYLKKRCKQEKVIKALTSILRSMLKLKTAAPKGRTTK